MPLTLLQCGAFIIIPITTFGFGVWKILQIDKKYHRISIACLIGFIFFEASTIGMLIDPRSNNLSFEKLILISFIIGLVSFLCVFLFLPLLMLIFRIFNKK